MPDPFTELPPAPEGTPVALTVGVDRPDAVAGVAVIDSPIDRQPPEDERLRDRRVRIPSQMSVTGFDDIDLAEMAKAQEQLKDEVVEASAGGGMVTVKGFVDRVAIVSGGNIDLAKFCSLVTQ